MTFKKLRIKNTACLGLVFLMSVFQNANADGYYSRKPIQPDPVSQFEKQKDYQTRIRKKRPYRRFKLYQDGQQSGTTTRSTRGSRSSRTSPLPVRSPESSPNSNARQAVGGRGNYQTSPTRSLAPMKPVGFANSYEKVSFLHVSFGYPFVQAANSDVEASISKAMPSFGLQNSSISLEYSHQPLYKWLPNSHISYTLSRYRGEFEKKYGLGNDVGLADIDRSYTARNLGVNFLHDLHRSELVDVSIGFGLGYASVSYSNSIVVPNSNTSGSVLRTDIGTATFNTYTYILQANVSYQILRDIYAVGGYKYIVFSDASVNNLNKGQYPSEKYSTQNINLALQMIEFGLKWKI